MSNVFFDVYDDRFLMKANGKQFSYMMPPGWGPPGACGRLFLRSMKPDDVAGKDVCEIGGGYYAIGCGLALMLGAKSTVSIEAYRPAAEWAASCYDSKFESVCGDCLAAAGDRKYELIIGSLPQIPEYDLRLDDRERLYQFGGTDGFSVIDQYLKESHRYLTDDGKLRLAIMAWWTIDAELIDSYTIPIHPNNPLSSDKGYRRHVELMFPDYDFSQGLTANIYDFDKCALETQY